MLSMGRLLLNTLFWCLVILLLLLKNLPAAAETIEEVVDTPQPAEEHVEEVITPVTDPNRMRLVQVDPVEVGHVRRIELEPGHFYDMKTVAVNPPIFLIPDFLTPEECERIKSLAQEKGLKASRTVLRYAIDQSVDTNVDPYFNLDTLRKFDQNGDQFLDVGEAREALSHVEGVGNMSDQAFTHFVDIVLDLDSDRLLSDLEFRNIPLIQTKISEWIANHQDLDKWDPEDLQRMQKGPDRISHQVWMKRPMYDEAKNITNRLIALTGLHPDIINTSEELQVVHYTPGGHYHAHHDSTHFIADKPCTHTAYLYPHDPTRHLQSARICRYMTVLYYLADTEEGGETAFPAADNETFSDEIMVKENRTVEPGNLSKHCKDANLYVKPKKRMAVMWYNHYFDQNTESSHSGKDKKITFANPPKPRFHPAVFTIVPDILGPTIASGIPGWLGDRNIFSFHGGCDVIKGEKWIANNWINVDDNYDMQMKFHYDTLYKPKEPDVNVEVIPKTEETTEDLKTPPDETNQESPQHVVQETITPTDENVAQQKQEL